jgi:hypothetical protein
MVWACLPANGLGIWGSFDISTVDVERIRSNNSRAAACHLGVHTRRIHDKNHSSRLLRVFRTHSSSHFICAKTAILFVMPLSSVGEEYATVRVRQKRPLLDRIRNMAHPGIWSGA